MPQPRPSAADPAAPVDVAVIGGGILGTSVAAELAARGRSVVLLDRGSAGNPASLRSIAWLNTSSTSDPAYEVLRTLALQRHLFFERTLPAPTPYGFDGSVSWSRDGRVEPAQGAGPAGNPTGASLGLGIVEDYERLRAGGHAVRLYSAAEIRQVEPAIRVTGPDDGPYLVAADEGYVDLTALLQIRRAEFLAHGGEVIGTDAPVRLIRAGDRVTALHWAAGQSLTAKHVVVAAGAATTALLAGIGVTVPNSSTTGALIVTKPVQHSLTRLLRTPGLTVLPHSGGGLLVHSTAADAAAAADAPGGLPDETVRAILREAEESVVAGGQLEVDRIMIGPRPVPGDGLPVVGPLPGLTNASVLFSHSGATLGLLLGELLAEEIVAEAPLHPILDPYRPARFSAS
jgi:glycine/D-amino acid oxidase-like deaminating enzyme